MAGAGCVRRHGCVLPFEGALPLLLLGPRCCCWGLPAWSALTEQLPALLLNLPAPPSAPCSPTSADSMFVLLPGRSRADAFRIGAEIAAAVTAANPPPVVLKMEKARGRGRYRLLLRCDAG